MPYPKSHDELSNDNSSLPQPRTLLCSTNPALFSGNPQLLIKLSLFTDIRISRSLAKSLLMSLLACLSSIDWLACMSLKKEQVSFLLYYHFVRNSKSQQGFTHFSFIYVDTNYRNISMLQNCVWNKYRRN